MTARATQVKKDSKDRNVLKIYLTDEQTNALIEEINKAGIAGGGRGINLTFHTGKKTAEATGRQFDSTFYFVKGTQERGTDGPGAGAPAPATRFVPKKPLATKTAG